MRKTDPFASDNAMRKVARESGLRVSKDRARSYLPGKWHVHHIITREGLAQGSRDEVATFIADYQPGEARLNVVHAIKIVAVIAPMIDWTDAREEEDYVWEHLVYLQEKLADLEPNPTFVHPTPPPQPVAGLAELAGLTGFFAASLTWMKARQALTSLYHLVDVAELKGIADESERRRAFAEAGRLRFYVDYVLEHRATWGEIASEEKAIIREADLIAGLRTDEGRHNENPALAAKRHEQAEKREAKLAERKAALAARLGIREERRYWWPPIREAMNEIKRVQDDIVAGYHTENLTQVRQRLGELEKLIARTKLLATDGDLRERTRKVRQASRGEKSGIERADDAA